MHYKLEAVYKNPNAVDIHVDCRLIQGKDVKYPRDASKAHGEHLSAGLEIFLATILEMDGIEQEIQISRYRIRIVKARLYPWKRILPPLVKALKYFIGNESGEVEIKKELTA